MIELIPYFAVLIYAMFLVAFSYAVTDGWNFSDKKK